LRSPYELAEELEVMETLKKYDMTAANINNFWNDSQDFPQVRTDIKAGVRMAVDHLKELGHKKIALVDESKYYPRIDVLDAFCKALMWNGLGFDINRVKYVMNYGKGWEEFIIDELAGKCSAVIFTYDYHAVQFIEKMQEKGIVPGKDLALVGIDNIFKAERIGLTSLAHPMHKIVETAFKIITGEAPKEENVYEFAPELIIRESTLGSK